MKKLAVIIAVVFLLTGCGSTGGEDPEFSQVTYIKDIDSGFKTKYDIFYDGEKIEKVVRVYEARIADSMFENFTVEELEKLFTDQYINPEYKVEGTKHEIVIDEKDKTVTVTSEIDPETVRVEQMPSSIESTELDTIRSLEKQLEDLGFTKQEDK